MITCYIIDDELHAIKSLQAYIEKTPWLQVMGYSENPLDALAHFRHSNFYADITFLDIEMPLLSGLEVSAMLKGKTKVVFTTAHPSFALEAFELEISDYLLKPFSYERFIKCVDKVNNFLAQKTTGKRQNPDDFFYIQADGKGKIIKILFKDILFIESQKNYLSISCIQKKYLTYLTLIEIEEKLPSSFIRINKSYIINTGKISHIEGNDIYLSGMIEPLILSSSYKDKFTTHMKEHLIKTKRS